ncbi:MFS general substrate transporter [Macrolepiota fuliginosa MF-IS2]|uniref:MFS general substrate transporter n=1 Tax=Macrolepiota fuliginosa MF-IS2 TaxID=1400762 RepID=A0A9P5X0Q6_9AGAR|nr:MFS general substrate transporter [Macrolepiota fuliginosa MF-IS2]
MAKRKRSYLRLEEFRRGIVGEDKFPDGRLRAWLVVFGVYQEYYQESILKAQSPSSICILLLPSVWVQTLNILHSAWIGSIQYALIYLPGLIIGHLFDLGYFHVIFLSSSTLLVLATFLTAQCTEYWQFLLCQGVAVGLGCGSAFGPAYAVIRHWFKKKHRLALGYMAAGSSLGGICLPITTKNLISKVGCIFNARWLLPLIYPWLSVISPWNNKFQWTMRITGFILLVVLMVSNLTMKQHLPPTNARGGLFNFAAFKSVAYMIYCLSGLLMVLGIFTCHSPTPPSLCQLRWATRVLADCIRVYLVILMNPIMNLGAEGDMGRRVGMYMTILACGLLIGPPILGMIETATGEFEAVGLYAGSVIIAGTAYAVVVRYLVLRRWIEKI